jgi:hypothetical protein
VKEVEKKISEEISEEIRELRHNELLAGILGIVLFSVFFCMGLFVAFHSVTCYEWRGSTLYQITSYPHREFGLILMGLGIAISLPFLIYAQYCSHRKKKLLRSIGIETHWWE